MAAAAAAAAVSPAAPLAPPPPPAAAPVATDDATVKIVKANGVTARTKHFERWVSYVRDLYSRFIITVTYLSTDEMPADIFTKALGEDKFMKFRKKVLKI